MTQTGSRRAFRRFRTLITETRQAKLLLNSSVTNTVEPSALHHFAKNHALYHKQPGWRYALNPRRNTLHKGTNKLTHQELQARAKERLELASI